MDFWKKHKEDILCIAIGSIFVIATVISYFLLF